MARDARPFWSFIWHLPYLPHGEFRHCEPSWLSRLPGFFPALLLALAFIAATAAAGDWPQILGPHRNGVADDEHLVRSLPEAGPSLVWQRSVGSGYAGPAVSSGRLILFHREDAEAIVLALDAAHRQEVVAGSLSHALYQRHRAGRRSALRAGDCRQLSLPVWRRRRRPLPSVRHGQDPLVARSLSRVRAPEGYFGAGSTPIVEDGKLLVNVGGRGAGIVALAVIDGSTVWKATDEAASYSSPIAATIDGRRQVIFVTRLNVVSVNPDNGGIRFRFPFGMRGPTVNAANPVLLDNHLFVTASYGVGAELATISAGGAKRVWAGDDVLSSQFTTGIFHGGTLFGIDGRQDAGIARLRAINPLDGRVLWTQEGFGTGTLILADNELLIMKTDGTLVLADPVAAEYRELAKSQLFPTTVQALPALADGLFYARDTRTLKCFDLGAKTGDGGKPAKPSP